jgi:hypothetical protein
MSITLDGFASGRGQSREKPFGDIDPERFHRWMFDTERTTRPNHLRTEPDSEVIHPP